MKKKFQEAQKRNTRLMETILKQDSTMDKMQTLINSQDKEIKRLRELVAKDKKDLADEVLRIMG